MLNFSWNSAFEYPLSGILVQLSNRTFLLTKRSYSFIFVSKAFSNFRHSRRPLFIGLFKLLYNERKDDFMANKTNSMGIRSGCASATLSLLLSKDEKQFRINTKKVYVISKSIQGSGEYRRASDSQPYPHAGEYTTEDESVKL